MRRLWSPTVAGVTGSCAHEDLDALSTDSNSWKTYKAPGADPHVDTIYIHNKDIVWASEGSHNAMLHFDPGSEKVDVIPLPRANAAVRQILGDLERFGCLRVETSL